MSAISEIIYAIVLGYAVLLISVLGISYVVPEVSVISQNTTFIGKYQEVISSFSSMDETIQNMISSLGSSQGVGDLVFVAFGSVITLIILVGQMLISAILLVLGLLIFPFELIEIALSFAPSGLTTIRYLLSSVLLIIKTVIILAVSLFLFFELVEFIGGRKP